MRAQWSQRAQRARDERGASAAILAMLMSAILIVSAAFAVDLGQQRVVRRDMQAVADVVALDMVRLLNGGTASSYGCASGACALETAKNRSLARNKAALGGELAAGDLTWDFVQRVDGEWETVAKNSTTDTPTAIKVHATSDTPFAFAGVVGIARGGSTRSAVAQAESFACIGIGSYAAGLDSSGATLLNPILGNILGSSVNLQAIGYNGLASASISLLDLLEAPGITVAGTGNLADIQPVSLAQLMIASASVLRKNGDTAHANVLYNLGPPPTGLATKVPAVLDNVNIGDLIDISQGASSALATNLNVFDLITSSIFLANGENAVGIPALGINLPLLGNVTGGIKVIQSPQRKCGFVGTQVQTSQVQIKPLTATLTGLPPIVIPGLTNISLLGTQQVILDVDAAKSVATITDVACDPDAVTARIRSNLTSISLTTKLEVKARIQILGILGLPTLVDLVLPYTITATPTDEDTVGTIRTMPVPPFDKMYPTGHGSIALDPVVAAVFDSAGMKATVAGIPLTGILRPVLDLALNGLLGPVLSAVSNIAHDLTSGIDDLLLQPLQDMLGVTVAGADVYVPGTREPECGSPKLVG